LLEGSEAHQIAQAAKANAVTFSPIPQAHDPRFGRKYKFGQGELGEMLQAMPGSKRREIR
jgi:hypothetical protein